MPNLEDSNDARNYSNNALNVRARFMRKRFICYVENNDDESFWRTILPEEIGVEIKGCSSELDKIASKIISGDVNALIARDRDYLDFTEQANSHAKILYTCGHSIENTLCHPEIIEKICETYTRDKYKHITDKQKFNYWLNQSCISLFNLHEIEISNHIHSSGQRIIGENCQPFMKSDNSDIVCLLKIEEKINSLSTVPQYESGVKIGDLPKIIRGHFYSSLIVQYICSLIQKLNKSLKSGEKKLPKLNSNELMNQALTIWRLDSTKNPHYSYYSEKIKVALI